MPSRRAPFLWLLDKEWRELLVSRSWWALLLAMGPLVGVSFSSAVHTYAEVSGLNGTSAGVGEALSPLIGIWAPTFSACELAAVFLLPFVAIRLVANDRYSGALKLEIQQPMSPLLRMLAKALVALAGWLIAMLPPVSAICLWRSYGGSIYPPELIALIAGHILNAGLTISLGAAAASLTEHPSTAAIVTLGVTVGTWIVSFFAAIHGGLWERIAGYIPAAMVAQFQHGLIRLDTVLIACALIVFGLALAAIWMRLGVTAQRRTYESIGLAGVCAMLVIVCTFFAASWDVSESRGNSFPEADEQALRQIHAPIKIEVHLAAEDPRRIDLERALSKLKRVLSDVQVQYVANTTTGLFEQTNAGYGEIWYRLNSRTTMSRVTTPEGVLEAIYPLAGITPPKESDDEIFKGHPLAVPATGANAIFYGLWPAMTLVTAFLLRKRFR